MKNESQIERFDLLQEESAEIIQAASKIKRFGLDNFHPKNEGRSNRQHLQNEIGNLLVILDMMIQEGDIDEKEVCIAAEEKKETIGKYLRYQ